MYLLGDIGNTDIKIFLLNNSYTVKKKLTIKTNLLSNKYLSSKLKFLLKNKKKINKVIFSSVVPNAFILIRNFLKKKIKAKLIFEVKKINLKNLINIKVDRKQVGSDRIANAVSVIDGKNNYIIIDFGTATTFDVVVKNRYLGGIIAPGVNLSLQNLSSKASLIPPINLSRVSSVIGTNTSKAVKSGFYWGYLGLIDNIVNLIKKQTRKSFKIILTGGLAHLFNNRIKFNSKIEKDLIINGLIKIIKNLKKNAK